VDVLPQFIINLYHTVVNFHFKYRNDISLDIIRLPPERLKKAIEIFFSIHISLVSRNVSTSSTHDQTEKFIVLSNKVTRMAGPLKLFVFGRKHERRCLIVFSSPLSTQNGSNQIDISLPRLIASG
jgi:hypothetical protein